MKNGGNFRLALEVSPVYERFSFHMQDFEVFRKLSVSYPAIKGSPQFCLVSFNIVAVPRARLMHFHMES